MNRRDPGRLHVLTDVHIQRRFDHVALARLAFDGGADVVQIREKDPAVTPEERTRVARAAVQLPGARRVLIDDAVDVAREAGAAGVHLGRDDPSAAEARRLLGRSRWIGSTANSLDEARERSREAADYLGVGPVFATDSKQAPAPVLGLEELRRIAACVALPVIAIGGIDAGNVAEVLATGVHGVAVLSAVVCAEDPAEATRSLKRLIEETLARRV